MNNSLNNVAANYRKYLFGENKYLEVRYSWFFFLAIDGVRRRRVRRIVRVFSHLLRNVHVEVVRNLRTFSPLLFRVIDVLSPKFTKSFRRRVPLSSTNTPQLLPWKIYRLVWREISPFFKSASRWNKVFSSFGVTLSLTRGC